jgi:NADH dehydrogenase
MDTFLKYYHGLITCSDISLYLINRDKEILGPFPPRLRRTALSILREKGVNVMLEAGVKEIQKDRIIFSDDKELFARHVVWTAGVKPNPPMFTRQVAADKGGRIMVTPTLQIPDSPNIFVIGDMASAIQADGKPLPMLAQIAERQGLHTGHNIKRLLKGKKLIPFTYKSQGELASLGQWQAVANIRGLQFTGPLAWFLWRTIYLFKFLSGSKRAKIVVDWTMNIFYPRDITKA